MSASSVHRHYVRGFTLVELLVVITIIGTLVALLLPAVLAGKGVARRSECVNNMRQLAQAVTNFDSSKGQLPGYSQPVRRGVGQYVAVKQLSNPPRWALATGNRPDATPISWVTMLLPYFERQDIWDQVVDPSFEPEIRPLEMLVCPSDNDAKAQVDVPALTYSVNAGAPDWDGKFLLDAQNPNVGDTTDNGVFLNLHEYAAANMKAPATRLSNIRDGAATTIMLSENIHKSYEPYAAGYPPRFSWAVGTEQHMGIVWVVNDLPQPGNTFVDQERIGRVGDDVYGKEPMFDPNISRFARPASGHPSGVNVTFCDSHTDFLRDDIDYVVYQQLLTSNGRKCVDPRDHNAGVKPPDSAHPIYKFRAAPPLSGRSYQ